MSFTRDQERRIARSLRLAKQLARQRGERIDSNEAALRVSRAFLDAHRGELDPDVIRDLLRAPPR